MRGVEAVPVELQPGLPIELPARVEVRVAVSVDRAGPPQLAVGRVVVRVGRRAAQVQQRHDIVVGVVQAVVRPLPLVDLAVDVRVVVPRRQRVDVVRMPDVLGLGIVGDWLLRRSTNS